MIFKLIQSSNALSSSGFTSTASIYGPHAHGSASSCQRAAMLADVLFALVLCCLFLPASGSCAPGTFLDLSSEECMPCFGAEYNPHINATACLACPPNSSGGALNIAESDCVCNRGFSGAAGGPCFLCAMGSFKTESSSAPCTFCSSGAYWPSEAPPTANYCLSCAENSSSLVPADGMCVCNRGFVRRNDSCYECAAGSYCPDQGPSQ